MNAMLHHKSLCLISFKNWLMVWRRRNAQTLRLWNVNNQSNVILFLDVYCGLIWSIIPYDLWLSPTWTHRLNKLIYSHKFHVTKFLKENSLKNVELWHFSDPAGDLSGAMVQKVWCMTNIEPKFFHCQCLHICPWNVFMAAICTLHGPKTQLLG